MPVFYDKIESSSRDLFISSPGCCWTVYYFNVKT